MRCESCPVDPGLTCASAKHARFCVLAATRPEYLPIIVRESGGMVDQSFRAEGQPAPDYTLYAKIEACDFRYSTCGCLSKAAMCRQFGYAATTDLAGCSACPVIQN